jgi:hypothetical protein
MAVVRSPMRAHSFGRICDAPQAFRSNRVSESRRDYRQGTLHKLEVVILSEARRSRRISVHFAGGAGVKIQRCFAFVKDDNADGFVLASRPTAERDASNQTSFPEVAKIAARRALHQVDGELEQANFPRFVYTLYDRAERFVFIFDLASGAINHRVD